MHVFDFSEILGRSPRHHRADIQDRGINALGGIRASRYRTQFSRIEDMTIKKIRSYRDASTDGSDREGIQEDGDPQPSAMSSRARTHPPSYIRTSRDCHGGCSGLRDGILQYLTENGKQNFSFKYNI